MLHLKVLTSNIWHAGLNLLFPPACANCEQEIEAAGGICLCDACRVELTKKPEACCPRCGDWNLKITRTGPRCASCARHKVRFEHAAFLGIYEHALRSAVLQLKHPAHEALALALGELSVERLATSVETWAPDIIAPVPMHWRRKLIRGVNSPEILGEVWSRRMRLPLERGLLIRRRNTLPQADLLPDERFRNMRGAFRVSANYRLRGAKILLVDDILTTGATCHEVALTLCKAGAKSVYVVALARAG
jgi:ComF family protein